ncbi:MAG TPA: ComEC/Rec2 family competence protein [Candidatus Xenobia bacterium]|nr:ComEC/Rec2 family competence protein [Candidatus Xenobia bacterium]
MRFPLFWLAVAYAAGLAAFADVDDSPRTLFAHALVALVAGTAALWRRWLRAAFTCALAGYFLLGGATTGLNSLDVPANRIDRLADSSRVDFSEAVRLTGWLRRATERKPFATIYELELETLETGGRVWPTSGGARLSYFPSSNERAASLPPLAYGDRVEVLTRVHPPINHQNLGSFDWRGYLARQDIYLEGSLKSPELLTRLPGRRGNAFLARVQALRTRLLAELDTLLPPTTEPDANAIVRAMLLGDRGFLSHELADQFRQNGTYHVLVISGLQMGIIAWFLFWLLCRMRAPDWAATLATIAALVFYLLLVEDRPPIERAVWMAATYLAARLLFREVHLANTTALAALFVLCLHPDWIFDPSFHLSFGAVFLIALFAMPWIERTSQPYREALSFLDSPERAEQLGAPHLVQFRHDLRALAELLSGLAFWRREEEDKRRVTLHLLAGCVRVGLRVWDFFVLSFAIQLGLLLLTAVYFDRIVVMGLLTNVIVVPLVGLIVPLGLATLLLSLGWSFLGAALAWLLSLLLSLLLSVAGFAAAYGLSYGIPPPPPWLTVLYFAALVALAVAAAKNRYQRWVALPLAALTVLVAGHPFPPQLDPTELEVTVLDVGQGDSLFLSFPNGETWLIDGGRGPVEIGSGYTVGESAGETVVVPYLRGRGLKRLDRVWLTHAHHDHMAGLHIVLKEFSVGSLNLGPGAPSRARQRLVQKARDLEIPVLEHLGGERFTAADVQVEVLWPTRDYQPRREPANDDSLVLRLCRRETCVLLPGDIEVKVEKTLVASGAPLQAAALKVPHHGGRAAAAEELLAAVQPQVAAISVGATNPFGHPYDDVLERLRARGARVYRTDRDGSITLKIGGGLRARSYTETHRPTLYPNLWAKLTACARSLTQPRI